MAMTIEDIQALRGRFALSEHTIRQGHTVSNKTKTVWFVYLDRIAIIDRLDELFPGEWEYKMTVPTYNDDHYAAVGTLIIKGVTRQFNGAFSGMKESENSEKGCGTDTFRRAASMWGIGAYLNDSPFMMTVNPGKDYKKTEAAKTEAMNKFREWFNGNSPSSNVTPMPKQATKSTKWNTETTVNFAMSLINRFPECHQALVLAGMKINAFSELGTLEQATQKVIEWAYGGCQKFWADYVMYYVSDDGSQKFMVFSAGDGTTGRHIAVRGYGRSSTIKEEWLGEYAYNELGFDSINKNSNKWVKLTHPLLIIYESKTKKDGVPYYVATGIGHDIDDPQVIADQELEY